MYYIKRDIDGYVLDVTNVKRQYYDMIYYPYALPKDIYYGYYKFENNRFVLDDKKKKEVDECKDAEISKLNTKVNRLQGAILELTDTLYSSSETESSTNSSDDSAVNNG
jgi:hypothetical protein